MSSRDDYFLGGYFQDKHEYTINWFVQARSRNHYRSGGYSSGSREPSGYSQGPAPVERRRFPRSITPEYERPPERDRSRERSRDRYIERDRSRGRLDMISALIIYSSAY